MKKTTNARIQVAIALFRKTKHIAALIAKARQNRKLPAVADTPHVWLAKPPRPRLEQV
jgi:hypothetical protein